MTTDLASLLDVAEAIVGERLARLGVKVKGDLPGHEFHGNQWTEGSGGGSGDGNSESMTLYHGTSSGNAEYISKHGWQTSSRVGGIEPDTPDEWKQITYLSPQKKHAEYFAKQNTSNKSPKIIEAQFHGKVLRVDGARNLTDQKVLSALGIHEGENGIDFGEFKSALLKRGYDAVAFNDRHAGNREAIAVFNHSTLKELSVTVKTIGQVTKAYADQLTNAVYDVFNGNSAPVDFRRAHKALLREYAPQVYEEGTREGGIDELDDDDKAAMTETVNDWLSEQVSYVNDFAAAIAEARKDKEKRPAILDRVNMWVDSLRSLGDQGRAYAMSNVKATWQLGDRQTHTPDCVALSKRPAHRVSWWTERGYQPPIHLGCGCALVDAKSGETIMGE